MLSGYHGDPARFSPPEKLLGMHLSGEKQRETFTRCCGEQVKAKKENLDYYEEAAKVEYRAQMQIASLAQDRRTFEHPGNAYNDSAIHCYMCFVCAEKDLHVGGWGPLW